MQTDWCQDKADKKGGAARPEDAHGDAINGCMASLEHANLVFGPFMQANNIKLPPQMHACKISAVGALMTTLSSYDPLPREMSPNDVAKVLLQHVFWKCLVPECVELAALVQKYEKHFGKYPANVKLPEESLQTFLKLRVQYAISVVKDLMISGLVTFTVPPNIDALDQPFTLQRFLFYKNQG